MEIGSPLLCEAERELLSLWICSMISYTLLCEEKKRECHYSTPNTKTLLFGENAVAFSRLVQSEPFKLIKGDTDSAVVFNALWQQAKEILSRCSIIGFEAEGRFILHLIRLHVFYIFIFVYNKPQNEIRMNNLTAMTQLCNCFILVLYNLLILISLIFFCIRISKIK